MNRKKESRYSISKSFCVSSDSIDKFEEFVQICKDNRVSVSEGIVAMILEKVHGVNKLQAQMKMENYERDLESQIPSLIEGNDESWKIFYQSVKSKEDYKKLDDGVSMLLTHHNRKLNDF